MTQRLMTFQAAPGADKQPESAIKTAPNIVRGHRRHPGCRQLDCQWNPVKAAADLVDHVRLIGREARRDVARTLSEQVHGRIHIEPAHWPQLLVDHAESFTAGGEDRHSRGLRENGFDQIRCRVEDVLAIVEHEQPVTALQCGRHRLGDALAGLLSDAEHSRHRIRHRRRISHCRQFENPYPVREFGGQLRGDSHCQPGLSDPADTGQRDQPT
jgi:hypothetical protein